MKYILVIYLLALSTVVTADPYLVDDPCYKKSIDNIQDCPEFGDSSPNTYKCLKHFVEISKNILKSSYNRLSENIQRDKADLERAQKEWEEFSKAQCYFESRASLAYDIPHRAEARIESICFYELNTKRAIDLSKIDYTCAACVH